ncbi:hypothetical protein PFISCL1PPCAC_6482, partial [Pristionchus fissidentatus]
QKFFVFLGALSATAAAAADKEEAAAVLEPAAPAVIDAGGMVALENWKCEADGKSKMYDELEKSSCNALMGPINDCCEKFDDCKSGKKNCLQTRKNCVKNVLVAKNAPVCESYVTALTEDEESEWSLKIIKVTSVTYVRRVVVYAKSQMETNPIRSTIIITLIFLGLVCVFLSCCCFCAAFRNTEKECRQMSESTATSVVIAVSSRE